MKINLIKISISTLILTGTLIMGYAKNLYVQPINKLFGESEETIIDADAQSGNHSVKNIILFIGDGMGTVHVEIGNIYKGSPLVFDDYDDPNWTYRAYANTDSLSSDAFKVDDSLSLLRPDLNPSLYTETGGSLNSYTDSAAAGTALATGQRTHIGRIGMDSMGKPMENLVEIASKLGKKTGVVTSDNMAGATPSAFLAHAGARGETDTIIRSASNSPADLIIAENLSTFSNNKAVYGPLFTNNGFDNIAYSLQDLDINAQRTLALLPSIGPYNPHTPKLADVTMFSLDYLDNADGFFLMVEGAKIDWESHGNNTVGMLNELLDFDRAVEVTQQWANGRDDTLIIVTADHETGALTYNRTIEHTKDTIVTHTSWLSGNHSRSLVPVDIYGDTSLFNNKYENHFSSYEGRPYWHLTDVFKFCSFYC
jgi:alkaline phosphatase